MEIKKIQLKEVENIIENNSLNVSNQKKYCNYVFTINKLFSEPVNEHLAVNIHNKVIAIVCFYEISEINRNFSIFLMDEDSELFEDLLYTVMNYTFYEYPIKKLTCEVLKDNLSIEMLMKYGFEVEGVYKNHVKKRSQYYDIYRMSCDKGNFSKYLQDYLPKILSGKKYSINVGDEYNEKTSITNQSIKRYAQISGDNNPIHLDKHYAQKIGFSENIVHGILGASIFSKVLGTQFPGDGSIYLSQELKFLKPIFPNAELTVKLKILSIIGPKLVISTQIKFDGSLAITGIAKVLNKNITN